MSLTLYVSGASPRSTAAIDTVRALCDGELAGQVDLQIIDVYDQPALVVSDDIIVTPTLIRRVPLPIRRLIGDLSDIQQVRSNLGFASPPATP